MEAHVREIERRLKRGAREIPRAKAEERRQFMKGVMPFHGLTVPQQRAILKDGYSFSGQPVDAQLPIWSFVWFNAVSHEGKMQAALYLGLIDGVPDRLAYWEAIRPWAGAINCWDQSDSLSSEYAALHEVAPALVYPTLEAWNRDPDPWKRRQSIVSLFYYAQLRKQRQPTLTKVLPLVEALLDDEDYYVQKGVGWTLRECFNVYPKRALAFLHKHAGDIRPAAFSAAIEKLSPAQKAEVKRRRKARRGR